MKKTLKNIQILVILVFLLILYLINSNYIVMNFLSYSNIFLTKIFPISFLFFIFSSLLIKYNLLEIISYYLKINTSHFYVFLLSLISGFPSGAKYTRDLWKEKIITTKEANQILTFAHFPNPFFILETVNTILKEKELAIKILLSIVISNYLLFLFCKKEKKEKQNIKNIPSNFSNALSTAIEDSFQTIGIIFGTSTFFYLIAAILTKYLSLETNSFILLNGLLDLTKGVFSTTLLTNNIQKAKYILIFISLGGISIHMQVKSILADTPISYQSFLKGRILGTILSTIIFHVLLWLS